MQTSRPAPVRIWDNPKDNATATQYPYAMDLLFELLTIPPWDQNVCTDILVRCVKWCPRGRAPFFANPSDSDLATLKLDMGSNVDPQLYMSRQDVQKLAGLAIAIGMSTTTAFGLQTRVVQDQAIAYRKEALLSDFGHEIFGMQVSRQLAGQSSPTTTLDQRIMSDDFVKDYKTLMTNQVFLVDFKARYKIGANSMLNDTFIFIRDEIKLRHPNEDVSALEMLGPAVGSRYGSTLLDAWTQLYDKQVFAKACIDADNVSHEESWEIFDGASYGTRHVVTHALGVNEWLDAQQSRQTQDGLDVPFIVTGSVSGLRDQWDDHGPMGCFIPGTKILTDRGDKSIESLEEGVKVLTRLNLGYLEWGSTSDETVKVPATTAEHKERIYGINQETPFFTAGHVFHTTTGLRAINPRIARMENNWLEVGMLRCGDSVLRLPQDWNPSRTSSSASYDIITIDALPFELTTFSHVYGVHLREGLRSYHANGYLVALNYPEITMQRLASHMNQLPPVELQSYMRDLKHANSVVATVLGHAAANGVNQKISASHPLNSKAEVKPKRSALRQSRATSALNTMDVIRSFRLRPRDVKHNSESIMIGYNFPKVTLLHGKLIIDGLVCERAAVEQSSVRWTRRINGNNYEHGQFRLNHTNLSARGSLLFTTDSHPNTLEGTKVLAAGDPTTTTWSLLFGDSKVMKTAFDDTDDIMDTLTTALTTLRFPNTPPVVTTPGWEQVPWSVAIGDLSTNGVSESNAFIPEFDALLQSIVAAGDQRQIKAISDKDGRIMNTIIYESALYLTGNVLCARFDVNMDWDRIEILRAHKSKQDGTPYMPIPGHLRFSTLYVENPDYLTLQGWYQIDPDTEDDIGKLSDRYAYGLISSISSSVGAELRRNSLINAQETVTERVEAAWRSVGSALKSGPAVATELLADNDNVYDLGDLISYTVWPDKDDDVQQAAQNQVTTAMLYHTSDTLRNLYGAHRPSVDLSIETMSDATKAFLATDLAKAYLCQGMSTISAFDKQFDDHKRARIEYFFTGKGKETLSQSSAYADATAICSRVAYLGMVPNLDRYRIKDGPYWANEMYKHVSNPSFITGLSRTMGVSGYSGPNLVNRYVMALDALDPSATWAKDFANLAIKQLADKVSRLKNTKFDKGELSDFLVQTMTGLIAQLIGTKSFPEDSVLKELKDDISKLGIIGEDLAAAQRAVLDNMWIVQLSCDILESIGNIRRGDGVTYSDKLDDWARQNPSRQKKTAIFKGVLMFCATAWSIFQGFKVLTGAEFNNLKLEQKMALVASLLDSVTNLLNGLKDAYDLWRTASLGGSGAAADVDNALSGSALSNVPFPEAIEMDNMGASVGENIPESVGSQAARQAVRPVKGKVAGFTYWEENFSVAENVSNFIGFAAACFATVALGFQVKADFEGHQNPGIKALDILQIIDVGLGAAVGGIAMVGAFFSMSFAAVPVVGTVLAVVGFVLMFVGFFVHPDPPESDAQKFLDDDGGGGSWISNTPLRPAPTLQYSLTPNSIAAGTAKQSFSLTITNSSSSPSKADIVNLILTWTEGNDDKSLFTLSDSTSFALTSPNTKFACGVPARNKSGTKVQLMIFVVDPQAENASLEPGEQMELVFKGTVGGKGMADLHINENTTYTEDPANPTPSTYTKDAKATVQVSKF